MTKQTDVHTEHCCANHGCKYGDDDCSVTCNLRKQSYTCGNLSVCGADMYDDYNEQPPKMTGKVYSNPSYGKYSLHFGDDISGHTAEAIFTHMYGDDPCFSKVTLMKGKTSRHHREIMLIQMEMKLNGLTLSFSYQTLDSSLMRIMENMIADVKEPMMEGVRMGQYYRPDKDVVAKQIIGAAMAKMSLGDLMSFTRMVSDASFESGQESIKNTFRNLLEAKYKT